MKFLKNAILVGILTTATALQAQTSFGRVEVRAVRGSATFSTANVSDQALRVGNIGAPGMTIKTDANSSVDIHLGADAGTLRLSENTVLGISELRFTETPAGMVAHVQLDLRRGSILGDATDLFESSKYEIKTPHGVAGVRAARFKCSANSFFLAVEGSMVFVHVDAKGKMKPHVLESPAYFSPFAGVKPAPEDVAEAFEEEFAAYAENTNPFPSNPVTPTLSKEPGTFTKR